MTTSAELREYPLDVQEEFARLAQECLLCYQCGQCTGSCPNGRDLYRGPRRLVRLILAGEIEAVLNSDDLWRCTECGTCTSVCRMDVDVAAVLARVRALERHAGSVRCPERTAAELAGRRLEQRPRIDNLAFGMGMAGKGHVPRDLAGAVGAFARIVRDQLPVVGRRDAAAAGLSADAAAVTLPFYGGCSLPQDGEMHALVYEVAAGFGVALREQCDAGCCGHPSRGTVASRYRSDELVYTACPACDESLEESDIATRPLWEELTDRAQRGAHGMRSAADAFVPYVGCLADRDRGLASLGATADLAGARMVTDFPALHSACCGALGGMYRGASKGSERLLRFARQAQAPVVTTCLLCRDNLRSATRLLKMDVPVYLWPEFFRAGGTDGGGAPDRAAADASPDAAHAGTAPAATIDDTGARTESARKESAHD